MLTKNLLKNRCRSGKIFPQFIKPDNKEALELASVLCRIFSNGLGKSSLELDEQLEKEINISAPLYPAFKKLLSDRCDWGADEQAIEENRWNLVAKALSFRTESDFSTLEDFQTAFCTAQKLNFQQVSDDLYSDLPEYKKMINYKSFDSEDLIHRYNCAQIQGMLLTSESVKLTVKNADLSVKRSLFRWIKFHQLLIEIDEDKSKDDILVFTISGPMSIFSNANTYGIKLANFFPRILHLENWEISADVVVKKKKLKLVLDQKVKIESYYRKQQAYIPKEFEHFIENFNKKSKDWVSELGSDFFNIGSQSYCFPDICFKGPKGKKVYLELFHKWHLGQVEKRLEVVEKTGNRQLIIGVCKSSAKKKDINKTINDSSWFSSNGFLFSDFPTHSAVGKILREL